MGLTWLILRQLGRLENTLISLRGPLNVGNSFNSSEAVLIFKKGSAALSWFMCLYSSRKQEIL
jgi:hypothetical protein